MGVFDHLGIPRRWVVYVLLVLAGFAIMRAGGVAAALSQVEVGLKSMVAPAALIGGTVSLLTLIAGAIMQHAVFHKATHEHGRRMIGTALVGMTVLGLGVAFLPHVPDLGTRLGNDAWQALSRQLQ